MALQASGAISLQNIATEFGGSQPHSLSEYYRGGGLVPSTVSAVPASGAISLSQFYGTQAVTLQTVNFPGGYSTWTAPAGVTNLVYLYGVGQDGYPGGWSEWVADSYPPNTTSLAYVERSAPASATSSSAEAAAQGEYDKFPQNGEASVSWTLHYWYADRFDAYARSAYVRTIGGGKVKTGNGWGSSWSNPPSYAWGAWNDKSYRVGNLEQYNSGANGADTVAFGYGFAGGQQAAASGYSVSNVAVTPGTTYQIYNNGAVQIQYYA